MREEGVINAGRVAQVEGPGRMAGTT